MLHLWAALSLIGTFILLGCAWRKRRSFQSIPGNKYSFYNILGDLIHIDLRKEFGPQMLATLNKLLNRFSNEQLMCLWVSYSPIVVAKKSDAVRELLKTTKLLDKPPQYEYMKPGLGSGLITSDPGKWKPRRKLLNPCFHSDVLRNYMETFNYMSKKLVNILHNETQKQFSHIVEPLTLCAFDAVCESIFGTKINLSDREKIRISNCLKRAESVVMTRIYSFWLWPEFIFWNMKIGKEFANDVILMHDFIKNMMEEKKQRYLRGERTIYNGKHRALIDVLLEKHLDSQELSEDDIKEEVITFMAAGHDTVAMAAMWAIYLIGQHPEVQAKMHEEIDRVFGEDKERDVTEGDLKDLQYLDSVLKECNRLYPPVPVVGRLITEETKICGYTVPKGTVCAIFMYFLHRDKEVFPEPEKFNPDRFSPENRVNIPEFAYIPFSAGPRNCIGYKFAEMQVGTILASVLRKFKVETLNKVLPMPGISLHASEPIQIKITSRAVKTT